MFNKLKLKNLIKLAKQQKVYIGNLLKGGAVLDIHFRRDLLEKTIYSFAGICIGIRKSGVASNVTIRNVLSLYTLEYTFNLFSPMVRVVIRKNSISKKSKLYYLRKKPSPLSKVSFQYILYK